MSGYTDAQILALMVRPAEVEKIDPRPIVVIPMCAVPDGKMPKAATALVAAALDAGMKVWSTYTMCYVPNVLRAGQRVVLELDSVVVRLRRPEVRMWASWHNGRFAAAQSRLPGALPVDRGAREIAKLVAEWQTVRV